MSFFCIEGRVTIDRGDVVTSKEPLTGSACGSLASSQVVSSFQSRSGGACLRQCGPLDRIVLVQSCWMTGRQRSLQNMSASAGGRTGVAMVRKSGSASMLLCALRLLCQRLTIWAWLHPLMDGLSLRHCALGQQRRERLCQDRFECFFQ